MIAAIALGSNLGDRAAHVALARRELERLPDSRLIGFSSMHETEPVGPGEQGRYLNAAALLETELPPRELLEHLLRIEQLAGRVRGEKWGPRTLDLDLLLYGDQVIDDPGLHVPHPRLHERAFVLGPLNEIAPRLHHPVLRKTIAELAEAGG